MLPLAIMSAATVTRKYCHLSFAFCSEASEHFSIPVKEVVATVSCFLCLYSEPPPPSFTAWVWLLQVFFSHNSPNKLLPVSGC